MSSIHPVPRVWLLAGAALLACDGTDIVSFPAAGDASTSAPPQGAPPRDAGAPSLDAGDAAPEPLDASTGDADGGDAAAPETRDELCARKDREFLRFVEQNRACGADADCTTVVDGGPNIDGAGQRVGREPGLCPDAGALRRRRL